MKYLIILLIFSSCQFDSKPNFNTIKSTPMNTQDSTIRLTNGAIYSFNCTNYVLDSYSQEVVKLKYLKDLKVQFLELPMQTFLNYQPINQGRL